MDWSRGMGLIANVSGFTANVLAKGVAGDPLGWLHTDWDKGFCILAHACLLVWVYTGIYSGLPPIHHASVFMAFAATYSLAAPDAAF